MSGFVIFAEEFHFSQFVQDLLDAPLMGNFSACFGVYCLQQQIAYKFHVLLCPLAVDTGGVLILF